MRPAPFSSLQRDKKTKKPIVAEGKVVSLTSHTLAPGGGLGGV